MKILQTKHFARQKKKLNAQQIRELDKAVTEIAQHPEIGEVKKGDLCAIRVYKFRIMGQLCLLAYTHDNERICLYAVGPHENFYRDLKRTMD